jgi:hypothetical protein
VYFVKLYLNYDFNSNAFRKMYPSRIAESLVTLPEPLCSIVILCDFGETMVVIRVAVQTAVSEKEISWTPLL